MEDFEKIFGEGKEIELTDEQTQALEDQKKIDDELAKELAKEDETDEDEINEINSLVLEYGFEKSEFENSTDGVKLFIDDLLIPKVREEAREELLNENELVKSFYLHLKEGNKPEDFFEKNIVNLEDEHSQKSIIESYLKTKNLEDDEIEAAIESFSLKGTLKDKAEEYKLKIDASKQEVFLKEKEVRKQEDADYKKQVLEVNTEIGKVLKSGIIAGVKLTAAETQELNSYLMPDKKGKRAIEDVNSELTIEQNMYLDYIAIKMKKGLFGKKEEFKKVSPDKSMFKNRQTNSNTQETKSSKDFASYLKNK